MTVLSRLALCALVLACTATRAGAAPTVSGDPVKIDTILSLTGTAAFLGTGEAATFKILEGVIDKQGGINGHPVQFVVLDDASVPATAVQVMTGIMARKPPAVLGTGFTATCNAILPVTRSSGPVTYCLTPGIHPPPGAYAFSANVGTESMAPSMLRFFKEHGWTKFAFMSSTDTSGQDVENAVNVAMQRPEFKGMTLVDKERFNVTDISVAAQIARIKSAQPQAVIFWTAGTGFGTLLRNAHDAGLDIPTMGGNANELYSQLAQYKGFLPAQLYFPSPRSIAEGGALPGPIHDAQQVYFAAFRAAGAKPDLAATMAWDPGLIVVDAYRKLGTKATPDTVRDYIEHLHGWVGVNGVYDFSDGSQRGIGENACVILRYDGTTFVNASRPGGRLK